MINRALHDLSCIKTLSHKQGQLVPVGTWEVLPGDQIKIVGKTFSRLIPMVAPQYTDIMVYLHYYYVPWRMVWKNWADTSIDATGAFITGGYDGLDATVHPYITNPTGAGGFAVGSLSDYLGLPTGDSTNAWTVSALYHRVYNFIVNEFYRDPVIQSTKRVVSLGDGSDTTTDLTLAYRNWEKDYLTGARPSAQLGTAVSLPLGTSAPVTYSHANTTAWLVKNASTGSTVGGTDGVSQISGSLKNDGNTFGMQLDPQGNLIADLSTATASTIRDLRINSAIQIWMETAMNSGPRYVEQVWAHFKVKMNGLTYRPEYLGGGKTRLIVSEVLQTSASDTGTSSQSPQGTMAGHGLGAQMTKPITKAFTEHGCVMALLSIMPRTMYQDGIPKKFLRTTKYDYYQPLLARVGMQTVYNKEVYSKSTTPDGVFGYQERYAEYRSEKNTVHGLFRTTLNYWHQGRIFSADQSLNSAFITSDPTVRIFAVQNSDTCYTQVAHDATFVRTVEIAGLEPRLR